MDGEVIGINTAIYSPSGGSIGIGFSIPANMAKAVVAQLKDFGHPRRGWLGVRIQQVTPDIAESLGLHDASGAMVAGVNDDGPADKANIRNGDIILKFNDQDVKEMRIAAAHRRRFRGGQVRAGGAVARRQGSDGAGHAGAKSPTITGRRAPPAPASRRCRSRRRSPGLA